MLKLFACFCLVCLAEKSVAAPPDRDGKWWKTRGETEKTIYTLGLLDGIETAKCMVDPNMHYLAAPEDPSRFVSENAKAIYDVLDHVDRRLFANVDLGDLIEGLNQFYKDFRNREIDVPAALFLVGLQISGGSDEEVQRLIVIMRKAYSEAGAIMKEQEQDNAVQKRRDTKP